MVATKDEFFSHVKYRKKDEESIEDESTDVRKSRKSERHGVDNKSWRENFSSTGKSIFEEQTFRSSTIVQTTLPLKIRTTKRSENSEAKCDFGLDKRILIEIIGWKNIRNQLFLLDLRQQNEHVKKTNEKERGEERHDAHTQPLIVETHPRDAPRSARVLHFDSIQA